MTSSPRKKLDQEGVETRDGMPKACSDLHSVAIANNG